MASESIARSAFGFMGYWLRAHSGLGTKIPTQFQTNYKETWIIHTCFPILEQGPLISIPFHQ